MRRRLVPETRNLIITVMMSLCGHLGLLLAFPEALDPFRVAGPDHDPPVLPYLNYEGHGNFDIALEVSIQPDGGEEQICIGIPTREQKKRKIWRGFFWVRHESDFLNFWLPDRVDIEALSERTGLEIKSAPVTHKIGGKKNSVLAMVHLSELDLKNPEHRAFITTIIDWNVTLAQRKTRLVLKNKREKSSSSPRSRNFDARKHSKIIDQLHVRMLGGEFEKACEEIALDILTNYEGFEGIEKGLDFRGTPFDFFGLKNGAPYIIELKASLKSFNAPGETQKWRMQELLKRIEYLNIALLQLKLNKAEYRIFYDEEMEILFKGTKAPLDPIERWIRERFG